MMRPRLRVVGLFTLVLMLSLIDAAWSGLDGPGLCEAALVLGVLASALDLYLAWHLPLPTVRRKVPERLSIGRVYEVEVTVENPRGYRIRLRYDEGNDRSGAPTLTMDDLPRALDLPAHQAACFTYRVRALQRGLWALAGCKLHVSGPLGLWEVTRQVPLPGRASVGPDLEALDRMAREAASLRRAYPEARACTMDPPKPSSSLLLWLDTGPAMLAGGTGNRAFDHAADAALAVGFMAVAEQTPVGLHLNAGSGPRHVIAGANERQLAELHRLLEACPPSQHPMEIAAEVTWLLANLQGRKLIVLITRLPADSAALAASLSALAQGHRLIVVDVIDTALTHLPTLAVGTAAQAQAYCRAVHSLELHEQAAVPLAQEGIEVIQAPGNAVAQRLLARLATDHERLRRGAEGKETEVPA